MSDALHGNEHQGTPDINDLNAQIAAEEAARYTSSNEEQPDETTAEPTPEPEDTPDSKPAGEPAAEEPEQHTGETDDEFEKRLRRVMFEKRKAEKRLREAELRIAQIEGKAPAATPDEEITRIANQRAEEMSRINEYNSRANSIYKAGVSEYSDFDRQLQGLRELEMISPELVEACDEVGEGHKILHYLGKHLDEAENISQLKGHRLGAAIGKIAAKMAAPIIKPQSKAPPPIKPLGGMGKATQRDDEMSTAEYMRREDERFYTRRRGG